MDRPGIKNWHWKQKELGKWARSWFDEQLPTVSADRTKIVRVKDIEEDCCTLGMRKSKLITVYDLKIHSVWEGQLADGTTVRGTITAVEVSHDMDEDDYVFETFFDDPSAYNSNSEAQGLRDDAHKKLSRGLAAKFQRFPKAMIDTHGADMIAAAAAAENNGGGSPASSGTSTPMTGGGGAGPGAASGPASASTGAAKGGDSTATENKGKSISTSTVRVDGEFMISAGDLFDLLTNEAKVPTWSRNKAVIKPEAGAEVSLFGGNITGIMVTVNAPNSFVQTWRAPTWPAGHEGELRVTLDQGSASTKLSIELKGVPVGKEEETEKGIEVYYIRSLKQIGLVTSSSSKSQIPSHPWKLPGFSSPRPTSTLTYRAATSASMAASVLVPLGFIGLFGWLLYRGPTFQG